MSTLQVTQNHSFGYLPNVKNSPIILDENNGHNNENQPDSNKTAQMPNFTFKLNDGASEMSYGINCARLAGFDKELCDSAQEYSKDNDKISRIMQVMDYSKMPKLRKIVESTENLSEKKAEILELVGPQVAGILSN